MIKRRNALLVRRLTLLTISFQTLQARAESSKGKATTARQRSDDAKSSLAANKSENAVLNTLTKLKTQGRLKGFHVSDL
jgi:structural maintenance of chromosome 4